MQQKSTLCALHLYVVHIKCILTKHLGALFCPVSRKCYFKVLLTCMRVMKTQTAESRNNERARPVNSSSPPPPPTTTFLLKASPVPAASFQKFVLEINADDKIHDYLNPQQLLLNRAYLNYTRPNTAMNHTLTQYCLYPSGLHKKRNTLATLNMANIINSWYYSIF